MKRLLPLCLCLLLLLQCAGPQILNKSFQPEDGQAFVFGDFQVKRKAIMGPAPSVDILLFLKNLTTGAEVQIAFQKQSVSPILVTPGSYVVKEVVLTDVTGYKIFAAQLAASLRDRKLEARPGELTYLGELEADLYFNAQAAGTNVFTIAHNNSRFDQNSSVLRANWKNFASVKIADDQR